MNLFYVLGTNNYIINSNLNILESPIYSSYYAGSCLNNNILFFRSFGGDGVSLQKGTNLPLSIETDYFSNFKYYSGFTRYNSGLAFVGCTSSIGGVGSVVSFVDFDGITYSESTIRSDVIWKSIAYGNEIYCAVGVLGTNELVIGTSTDKLIWKYNSIISITPVNYPKIIFGDNKFIICDGTIYLSTSGSSWITVDTSLSTTYAINYNKNGFIILGDSSSLSSSDGVLWFSKSLPNFIGTPSLSTVWNNLVSNNDLICMSSNATITNTFSNMTSVIFSRDNGNSWINQTLMNGGNKGIFSLSIPSFWTNFIETSEDKEWMN